MKKILLLLAVTASPFLFTACGDKKNPDAQEEVIPEGMMALDLTSHGFPVKITVPDSAKGKGKVDVSEGGSWGGAAIRIGKAFQMNINIGDEESTNLSMQKQLLAATDIGTYKYDTDNDTALVYTTTFGEGTEAIVRHHFYLVLKIGKEKYVVRDINDPENEFTDGDIKTMMEAAHTLRPAPQKPAEPKS